MKKLLSIISLLGILILSGCGGSGNVVEYNDNLVSIVKECTDANQSLFQTFQSDKSTLDSISESLQSNIDICNKAKEKALELGDYKKDSSLKDAVVSLLETEVIYLQKFSETSRYRNINDLTEEDKTAYESISSDLNNTQNSLNQQFTNLQDVQEGFAVKYGLKLE